MITGGFQGKRVCIHLRRALFVFFEASGHVRRVFINLQISGSSARKRTEAAVCSLKFGALQIRETIDARRGDLDVAWTYPSLSALTYDEKKARKNGESIIKLAFYSAARERSATSEASRRPREGCARGSYTRIRAARGERERVWEGGRTGGEGI